MGTAVDRKNLWVGDAVKGGIVQRLGIACYILSFVLVVLALNAPGDASIRYWLFFAAHGFVYSGFVIAAIADRIAGRRFDTTRLVFTVICVFLYLILCPVVMSAAAAAQRTRDRQLIRHFKS